MSQIRTDSIRTRGVQRLPDAAWVILGSYFSVLAGLLRLPFWRLIICVLFVYASSLVNLSVVRADTEIAVNSPNNVIQAAFSTDSTGQLQYRVSRGTIPVVETTPLGVTVDGVALGTGVILGSPTVTTFDETYATLGVHPVAVNHYTQTIIPIIHSASNTSYSLEVRAFDDGLAYRYNLPGTGTRTVNTEQSSWKIPDGSTVWIFENSSDTKLKTYAGSWTPVDVNTLPSISPQGPIQGAGITLELPNNGGYAVLSEAALANYSGMRLEAIGERTVRANFSEGSAGFNVNGPIVTPWRFTLTTADLNGLVNADLVSNLSPAPDPAFYGDRSWIKPGRSVWRWLSSGTGTLAQEKAYVDYAAQMGYEYSTVDNGWETLFAQNGQSALQGLKELCDYARAKGVGIFVWKNSNALLGSSNDWQNLRTFLDNVKAAGAAGVKIDYIYAESKNKIDFETVALRKAAERKLLVNFHGISKPTGELRTYPNQLTREAVRGLEVGLPGARHDAALPFTRFVLGPADYTPLAYTNNYAEQLATLVIYTSPLQVVGASSEKMLADNATAPALDVVKAIPATWDETRVLAPSQIGKLALYARRSGERWFLAGINGDKNNAQTLASLDLSFLGTKRYSAVVLTSGAGDTTLARRELADVGTDTGLSVDLVKAGGFVALFTPTAPATRAATTTSLAASTTTQQVNVPVTLVANVRSDAGTPSGGVNFREGNSVLGSAPVDASGRAVFNTPPLAVGEHILVAVYTGDSSFASSESPSLRLTIVAQNKSPKQNVFLPLVTSENASDNS